jgi:hypothetical protein
MKKQKIEEMYLSGNTIEFISTTLNTPRRYICDVIRMIEERARTYDTFENRIKQAKLMEDNIFSMIKKKQDISGLIKQFSSFCA